MAANKPAGSPASTVNPDVSQRRSALAEFLLRDVHRLRGQLFAPAVERRAVVVQGSAGAGSHVEIVDIELDEPTFASKRLIIASIAEALDKILELDALAPTEGDGLDEIAAKRARRQAAANIASAGRGRGVERRAGGGRSS